MDHAITAHRETTRLGSYEILRRLARGGMAEIFLARTKGPSGFEKLVVLKKILARYSDKPRYVQLFLEEAKIAASLDHPHIAQVYDIGMVDGSYFFAMEHLHGHDVRSILHRSWRIAERFPIEHAVQIARHVGSALHYAHDKRRSDGTLMGLVHRDVSPSNIIVTYDGATKLLDFGVAKTAVSTVKTRTGALKGKIAYMSPEQARGAPIDRRSDVFALGIVLWEMLTTQRLYRADNDFATLQLIINQPPRRPSQARPECPPELERIVLRALAQDPAARYQTAEDMVNDLEELAREHKLKQSSNALAATLGHLFEAELAAWRQAQAAGIALADHLHDVSSRTAPISESDFLELDEQLDDRDDADGDDEPDDLAIPQSGELDDPVASVDDVDEDDDEDLTEHMAPVVDTLSPLAGDPVVLEPMLSVGAPSSSQGGPARLSAPPPTDTLTVPAAVIPSSGPLVIPGIVPAHAHTPAHIPGLPLLSTALDPGLATEIGLGIGMGPSPAQSSEMLTTPGVPFALARASAGAPTLLADPPQAVPAAVGDAPSNSTPALPFAAVASRVSRSPLAAAPWQAGQPSPPAAERAPRPWSIIDLPEIDPDRFARQRSIVTRVALGLIGLVIALAAFAGRC